MGILESIDVLDNPLFGTIQIDENLPEDLMWLNDVRYYEIATKGSGAGYFVWKIKKIITGNSSTLYLKCENAEITVSCKIDIQKKKIKLSVSKLSRLKYQRIEFFIWARQEIATTPHRMNLKATKKFMEEYEALKRKKPEYFI